MIWKERNHTGRGDGPLNFSQDEQAEILTLTPEISVNTRSNCMTLGKNRTRQFLLYIAFACVVYLGLEGLCYFGLMVLRVKGLEYHPLPTVLSQEQKNLLKARLEDDTTQKYIHHPVMGWAPKPLVHTPDVKINSQGIRSERDYSQDVPSHVIRVSTFGDSFTFGADVANDDTWESQLEEQDARFEVLNFGTGAYGLDQAYLRYLQDGVPFHSDIVIIGFMSENIYRNLNVFRPFYNSLYKTNLYAKPRFSIENGDLILFKNPLPTRADYERFVTDDEAVLKEIGNKDYYYQIGYHAGSMDGLPSVRLFKIATRSLKERLNPVVTREGSYAVTSEAFRLTTRLLEAFYCAALQHESLPVIVIYPDLGDLSRHRGHQLKRYESLLEHLHMNGFRYLDQLDALAAYDPDLPKDQLTVGPWGHYSRLGNKIVASYLHSYLRKAGLVSRDAIKSLTREARANHNCRPNSS